MKENNEKIAKFLGWEQSGEHNSYWSTDNGSLYTVLLFDTNWYYLMMAVQHCKKVCPIIPYNELDDDNEFIYDFFRLSITTPIDTVYRYVIAFIEWYNKNKK